MLSSPGNDYTGRFEIDELLLRRAGWKTKAFAKYATVKDDELLPDLFIPDGVFTEVEALRAADAS